MPYDLKATVLKPKIKKESLDSELFSNYLQYIEISSWEVLMYGIYARVNLFSQNERASATSE